MYVATILLLCKNQCDYKAQVLILLEKLITKGEESFITWEKNLVRVCNWVKYPLLTLERDDVS